MLIHITKSLEELIYIQPTEQDLQKAKYIRRTGTSGNYRYYYKVPGRGIVERDHIKEGSRFRAHADHEHHYHIAKVDGDDIHIHKIDKKGKRIAHNDGSAVKIVSHEQLRSRLHDAHKEKIKAKRKRLESTLHEAKQAKEKGVAKTDYFVDTAKKRLKEHEGAFGEKKTKQPHQMSHQDYHKTSVKKHHAKHKEAQDKLKKYLDIPYKERKEPLLQESMLRTAANEAKRDFEDVRDPDLTKIDHSRKIHAAIESGKDISYEAALSHPNQEFMEHYFKKNSGLNAYQKENKLDLTYQKHGNQYNIHPRKHGFELDIGGRHVKKDDPDDPYPPVKTFKDAKEVGALVQFL